MRDNIGRGKWKGFYGESFGTRREKNGSQGQGDAVGDDVGGEAGRVGIGSLIGGENMQFDIVSGFFLDVGAETGQGGEVPLLHAFEEYSDIVIAPLVGSAFGPGTEKICRDGPDA